MLFEIEIQVVITQYAYVVRDFVQAEQTDAAKRYARQMAAGLYPGAKHDRELDVYSSYDAQWVVARVAPVECLYAHVVREDGRNGSSTPVALVPWHPLRGALALGAQVLRALAERADAEETIAALKTQLGYNDVTLATEAALLEHIVDLRPNAANAGREGAHA